MELSFVTSALRRYFWVVILFAALGAIPGLLRPGEPGGLFESTAVLLVAPSTESRVQTSSGDADRYISGQLSVLRSDSLADQVATSLNDDLAEEYTPKGVQGAVEFSNEPRTDIVLIEASTPRPEVSQAIGNAYIDQYFEALRTQVDEAQEPEIAQLTEQTEALRARLDEVDQQLAEAMRPYLPSGPVPEGLAAPPIPALEQVAPDLVSDRQILLTEYESAAATLSQLETSARLRVATEVVQRATLPTEPEPTPTNRLLIAGVVGGAFLGLLVAVVLARLSPRVLDDSQAADILGQPMVGAFPALRGLGKDRRAIIERVPPTAAPFVNTLCVRAELDRGGGAGLTIVVVATRGGAGCTTLASAVANRFATSGSSVLLVDADPRHRELATLFSVFRPLESQAPSESSDHGRSALEQARANGSLRSTPVPNLSVAMAGGETLRRPQRVQEQFEQISTWTDVIVYDGGALLASASTVELTNLCDSVIVAVPRRATIRGLNAMARTLRRRDFLPVWTPVGRRSRSIRRRPGPEAEQDVEDLPDDVLVPSSR